MSEDVVRYSDGSFLRLAVLGIDPSLTSCGWCIIPTGWKLGDWGALKHGHFGETLTEDASATERVDRIARIVRHLDAACHDVSDLTGDYPKRTTSLEVYIEDYAYGLAGRGGMRLAELGGAIKHELRRRHGIVVEPVNMTRVRKLLIQRGSGRNIKQEVCRVLKANGALFESDDESDAFAVANYGRSELGLSAMTLGPSAEEAPARKRKRRA